MAKLKNYAINYRPSKWFKVVLIFFAGLAICLLSINYLQAVTINIGKDNISRIFCGESNRVSLSIPEYCYNPEDYPETCKFVIIKTGFYCYERKEFDAWLEWGRLMRGYDNK